MELRDVMRTLEKVLEMHLDLNEGFTLQGYSSEWVDISFPDGSHWRLTAQQTQAPAKPQCPHTHWQSIGTDGFLCLDCGYAESPSDPAEQQYL